MSYLIEKVEILYPRLNKTYKFDQVENRSVPCGELETGAKYETSFRMDRATAKALMGHMATEYIAKRKDSWPEKIPMPFVKGEDDMYVGKANLKGSYDGVEKTKAPKQYDSKNTELPEGFELTTGSTASLAVEAVPYSAPSVGTGVSLRLRAVQVIEHKPYVAASPFTTLDEGFDSTEGMPEEEENPFVAQKDASVVDAADVFDEGDAAIGEPPVEEPKKKKKAKSKALRNEEGELDLSDLVADWDDD